MSVTYIRLETIAGPEPIDAFIDACRVAALMNVWVMVKVNEVDAMIAPGDAPNTLHKNWLKAVERGATFVSANVIQDPRPSVPNGHQGGAA